MPYEYLLTYHDYLNAQRLYRRHRPLAAIRYYLWIWVLPILGLVATVPFILGYLGSTSDKMAAFAGLAAAGLWFALVIPISRLITLRRCWKQLLPPDVRDKPVTLEVTPEQVISAIPNRSEGRFFWSAIQDYAEDDKIALLFIQKKKFLFIPKHALPDAAWRELKANITNFGSPT